MPEDVTIEDVEDLYHRVVAARPEGRRDLPRQLQGRPAALDAEEGGARAVTATTTSSRSRSSASSRRSSCRSRSGRSCRARAASKTFSFRVADCHGYVTVGRVRGRPSRRDVPEGGEAGLDARRHHGRVRDLGQPRPAVRRAARGVRRHVHEHALRARGHDRRPRHPVRDEPRRLHLPAAGRRVPAVRGARGARRAHGRRAQQPTLPGVEEAATPQQPAIDLLPPEDRAPSAAHPSLGNVGSSGGGAAEARVPEVEMVLCHVCGDIMQRAGSCHACPSCGATSGCS